MATNFKKISGLGDKDSGALTFEQQSLLNEFKVKTRVANEKYMRDHVEIAHVLEMFVREVLNRRPNNIREFAAGYFSDIELKDQVQQEYLL